MPPRAADGYARRHRLCGQRDFAAIMRARTGASGARLSVLVRPNDVGVSRLGMIVPKALAAHAVDRNYIRRVAREQFRLAGIDGYDVIVRLRQRYQREPRGILGRELAGLLARALPARPPQES
jgi:ribonuclease P protein component